MTTSNRPDDNNFASCYDTLGVQRLERLREENQVKMVFTGTPQFLNPSGSIMGGFLSAMLDAALGEVVVNSLSETESLFTLDIRVSFIAPARAGKIFAESQLIKRGKRVAFSEARLLDEDGKLIATGSGTFNIYQMTNPE